MGQRTCDEFPGARACLLRALALVALLGLDACASNPTRRCTESADCRDDDVCYRGFCIAPGARDVGTASDASRACPPGQTACDGRCFDLLRDREHCGRCDVSCHGGSADTCTSGRCTD